MGRYIITQQHHIFPRVNQLYSNVDRYNSAPNDDDDEGCISMW